MSTNIEVNLIGFNELNLKQKVDQIIQAARLAQVEKEKKETVEVKAIEKAKSVAAKKGNLPAQQAKGKTKGSSNTAAIQAKKAGATVAGNRYRPSVTRREQVPATTKPTCIGPTAGVYFHSVQFKNRFTLVIEIRIDPTGLAPRRSLGPLRARVKSSQVIAVDENNNPIVPQPVNLPSLNFEGIVAEPWDEELPPPPDRIFAGIFEIEYSLADFPPLNSTIKYLMDIGMSVSGGFCNHIVQNTAQAIFTGDARVVLLVELHWINGEDYDLNVGFNQSIQNIDGYTKVGGPGDDFLENYVGWYMPDYTARNFLFHAGDDVSIGGYEYAFIDLTRTREGMPSWAETSVTLELRAYCYGALSSQPLTITVFPVYLTPEQEAFDPNDQLNEITRFKNLGLAKAETISFTTSLLDDNGNLGEIIATIPVDFTTLSWSLEEYQ